MNGSDSSLTTGSTKVDTRPRMSATASSVEPLVLELGTAARRALEPDAVQQPGRDGKARCVGQQPHQEPHVDDPSDRPVVDGRVRRVVPSPRGHDRRHGRHGARRPRGRRRRRAPRDGAAPPARHRVRGLGRRPALVARRDRARDPRADAPGRRDRAGREPQRGVLVGLRRPVGRGVRGPRVRPADPQRAALRAGRASSSCWRSDAGGRAWCSPPSASSRWRRTASRSSSPSCSSPASTARATSPTWSTTSSVRASASRSACCCSRSSGRGGAGSDRAARRSLGCGSCPPPLRPRSPGPTCSPSLRTSPASRPSPDPG